MKYKVINHSGKEVFRSNYLIVASIYAKYYTKKFNDYFLEIELNLDY